MSYKFDSLIIILNKIDSGGQVTLNSLLDEIQVKERTMFRYIKTLQVAGFPIYYDRKRESYAFVEGYSLRKPNITLAEGLALALAKNVLKSFSDGIEASIESIEKKLAVKSNIKTAHLVVKTEETICPASNYLNDIHEAILNFQRIELTYNALSSGESTTRKIDPYYLLHHDGFWHVRGYCHLREEFRLFALDRISLLRTLREYFVPVEIAQEEELSLAFGNVLDGEPVNVVLRFDKSSKEFLLRKKWHPSQQTKELKDGRLEMTFTVGGTVAISYWINKWIPWVEVIKPKFLRTDFKKRLLEAAGKNQ